MAVKDWGHWNNGRWLIKKNHQSGWIVWPSVQCFDGGAQGFFPFPTFTEAHAAYLDAVTCESTYDATGVESVGQVVRCVKARGHNGRWHECAVGGWTRDNSGAVFAG